jgi:hypothetical protein
MKKLEFEKPDKKSGLESFQNVVEFCFVSGPILKSTPTQIKQTKDQ